MSCDQCSSCAFRPGSEANSEPENHIKGVLTVMAAAPFYCHETLDWKRPLSEAQIPKAAPAEMRARLVALTLPDRTAVICQGWKAAVAELARRQFYRGDVGRLRRHVARRALRILYELDEVSTGIGKKKIQRRKQLLKQMEPLVMMLIADAKELRVDPRLLGL